MSKITIYHNPSCGTSRNVLTIIRETGEEPNIVEYLKTPPDKDELKALLRHMGMKPRDLLRKKGDVYDKLKPDNPKLSDDQVIDLMLKHPVLIERPVVVTPRGVRLCRPAEAVFEILPEARGVQIIQEDSCKVVDLKGRPVK